MRLPVDLSVQQHVRLESLRCMDVKKALQKKRDIYKEIEEERVRESESQWVAGEREEESTNKSSGETMLLKVANCPALLLPGTAGWARGCFSFVGVNDPRREKRAYQALDALVKALYRYGRLRSGRYAIVGYAIRVLSFYARPRTPYYGENIRIVHERRL